MSRLETREIAYFVAVAEELHFGRAAERLAIAQPALSKAIRRLESRLGTTLCTRSSRHVSLTPAGDALLHHGRHALLAVDAAAASVRRAAERPDSLRLAVKPGGDGSLLPAILAAHAAQSPTSHVEVIFGEASDRADYVRGGRADVALLYPTFDDMTDLSYHTLLTEHRVAVLPRGHRLARRRRLRLADLVGETLPRWHSARRDLPGAGDGPEVRDIPELLDLIKLGRTVAMLPRSLVEPTPADMVLIPVSDAPPSTLVVAWASSDHRPATAAFVAAAVTSCET